MEYYYTAKANISGDKLLIRGNEERHLTKVLRKKPGDEIYVTDGERNLFRTRIRKIANKKIECDILEKLYNLNEPDIRVGLFQSLLKSPDRFEFVIEKATELGADEIYPLISENVVNKTRDRRERWQAIALAAMKQSQRCYLPIVNHPKRFDEAIEKATDYEIKLIAHERKDSEGIDINKVHLPIPLQSGNIKNGISVCIFVGSEGGFSDAEIEKAVNNGFKIVNLGSRKLRSETAAIVILSALFLAE